MIEQERRNDHSGESEDAAMFSAAETAGSEVDAEKEGVEAVSRLEADLRDAQDRYVRLYAEFENYRKKAQRDREEVSRYSNEAIVYELLPVLDTLEMALKHAGEEGGGTKQSLREGVENTLREFLRVLAKFGLKPIEAFGRPFDPAYHHAMIQAERDDVEDKTVVEEFRKGYEFHDKVLRPTLVAVSKKSAGG
ncbi:MAG: nucleotide exchange factor GrpE [Chloroflexota bacterium]